MTATGHGPAIIGKSEAQNMKNKKRKIKKKKEKRKKKEQIEQVSKQTTLWSKQTTRPSPGSAIGAWLFRVDLEGEIKGLKE